MIDFPLGSVIGQKAGVKLGTGPILVNKPTKRESRSTTRPVISQWAVDQTGQLTDQLRELRLPSVLDHYRPMAIRPTTESV